MICLFCGAEPLAYSLYHAGGLCVPSANRTAVETQLFDEMLRDLQRYNDYRRNADAVFAPVDGFDPLPALTTAIDALEGAEQFAAALNTKWGGSAVTLASIRATLYKLTGKP